MNEVLGIGVAQGGAAALVALIVILVLNGRLVPRSTLQDALTERDTWREAHRRSEEARLAEREQTAELLEMSRIAQHVLTALPRPSSGGVSPDGPLDHASTPPPAG